MLHWARGFAGLVPSKVANAQSRQAAVKALELDERLPEAHGIAAVVQAGEFDWKGAEREFRRALELGPEVSDVWLMYSAFYLVPLRRMEEAVAAGERALDLDPYHPFCNCSSVSGISSRGNLTVRCSNIATRSSWIPTTIWRRSSLATFFLSRESSTRRFALLSRYRRTSR